jgi:hypothetical protein
MESKGTAYVRAMLLYVEPNDRVESMKPTPLSQLADELKITPRSTSTSSVYLHPSTILTPSLLPTYAPK